MNIELARLVSIPFNNGWATGLGQLLKKLEAEQVPKHPQFGPGAVASWWRGAVGHAEEPTQRPEKYASNWFPIRKLPPRVCFHTLENPQGDSAEAIDGIPYPAFHHGHHLISFAEAESLGEHLAGPLATLHEQPYKTSDFIRGALPDFLQRSEARNHIQRLVRLAWEKLCAQAGLEPHELWDGSKVYWFKHGLISKDTVYFTGLNGKRTRRQVVGRNNPRDRYWHFGVRAFPMTYPLRAYAVIGVSP